jgi:hypothetical protein
MPRIVTHAMPILGPLIDGMPRAVATDEQSILSRWADKTVMVMPGRPLLISAGTGGCMLPVERM